MYAIVDIETTGSYAYGHRIIEIAIVHHDGIRITDQYCTLLNPYCDIPDFIITLTGITPEMVKDAPSFEEVSLEIASWLDNRVFVAHSVQFDYSFIKKEFEDIGINWSAKKLCTIRLGKKIIPDLDSYSLSKFAASLGIEIDNRHRATGDAVATAKIFGIMLQLDKDGIIEKSLKRNSGELILPSNLPKADFDALPNAPGLYYFIDAYQKVIYVGKSVNIKKRIASHFSGVAGEWNRSNIRNEIHHIYFKLTGNELIALIYEAQEIQRKWPKYNLAQKSKTKNWGVYKYIDQNGYVRLAISSVNRSLESLIEFKTKGEAWSFLWNKVTSNGLCPKLAGLQQAKGGCISMQKGICSGACVGQESEKNYNDRVERTIKSFLVEDLTFIILGRGRKDGEKSVVLVDRGKYYGFGFIDNAIEIKNLEEGKKLVPKLKWNQTAQNLIGRYYSSESNNNIIVL